MATNEQRARLCGWTCRKDEYFHANGRTWWYPKGPRLEGSSIPPQYSSSLDACAELIDYLWHHQGHNAVGRFFHEFTKVIGCARDDAFAMLRATPQQICAAFDATFKDELNAK